MKTLTVALLLVFVLALPFVASSGAATQTTRVTWEYKFVYEASEKKANEMGQQGWELVAVGASGSGPASNVQTFVFKRARQ